MIKNIYRLAIICILFLSCSKDQKVLLKDISEDGGIYYYEGKPFSGIGFSNWSTDRKKQEFKFKNGKILSTVRYSPSGTNDLIDSLVFDENQNLIYQKRRIREGISIERDGYNNQGIFSEEIESFDESVEYEKLKLILENGSVLFYYLIGEVSSYEEFTNLLTNINHKSFIKLRMNLNRSNDIPELLSGQRYRGDVTKQFDNLDYHFQGNGFPQIDGRYTIVTDLYIFPEFGYEGTLNGFSIHTRVEDESTNIVTFLKHHIDYEYNYTSIKKPENFDKILNSFFLAEKISDERFKYYIKPFTVNDDKYNDPFKPTYYVFDLDFSSGDFKINFYSDERIIDEELFLAYSDIEPRWWLKPTDFYYQSEYDDSFKYFNIDDLKDISNYDELYGLYQDGRDLYRKYEKIDETLDENPIDLSDSFKIKIKDKKNNINIRRTPVNGSVIGKVSEKESYTVSDVFTSDEPLYLLNKKLTLEDVNNGTKIEKPKNFKLKNVKSIDNEKYSAEVVNLDETINYVYVKKTDVKISNSEWYYLKEKNGWIYSDFCDKLN